MRSSRPKALHIQQPRRSELSFLRNFERAYPFSLRGLYPVERAMALVHQLLVEALRMGMRPRRYPLDAERPSERPGGLRGGAGRCHDRADFL